LGKTENLAGEFDQWADVLLRWSSVTDRGDTEFYRRAVLDYGRPAVELGIGSGRVAQVAQPDIGLDFSTTSLQRCADLLVTNPPVLVHADIATYLLDQPARLSYAPQNTFNHIVQADERVDCFRNVARNTERGGYLLFDAFLTDRRTLRRYNRVEVAQARGAGWVLYLSEEVVDDDSMLSVYHAVLEELDQNGVMARRTHLPPLPRAYVPPHRFAHELTLAGWQIRSAWGDFTKGPLTDGCERQVWLAQKP